MRTYLVESFWPGITEGVFGEGAVRARTTAREMRASGCNVSFLGGVLVLRDEVAFWRFACDSATAAEEISTRAGLPCERVLECLELDGEAR